VLFFGKRNDGKILGCNELLCHILDRDKFDIIGKHINEVMPNMCEQIQEVPLNASNSTEIEVQFPFQERRFLRYVEPIIPMRTTKKRVLLPF